MRQPGAPSAVRRTGAVGRDVVEDQGSQRRWPDADRRKEARRYHSALEYRFGRVV